MGLRYKIWVEFWFELHLSASILSPIRLFPRPNLDSATMYPLPKMAVKVLLGVTLAGPRSTTIKHYNQVSAVPSYFLSTFSLVLHSNFRFFGSSSLWDRHIGTIVRSISFFLTHRPADWLVFSATM